MEFSFILLNIILVNYIKNADIARLNSEPGTDPLNQYIA